MARKTTKSGQKDQPSLFGDGLPEVLAPGKVISTGARAPTLAPPQPNKPPTRWTSATRLPARLLGATPQWLRKIIAEAAHKIAVKGVVVLILALVAALMLGFFAVLRFDHKPWVARYHDFMEQQIYAKAGGAKSGPAIETGSPVPSAPASPPSSYPAPGAPERRAPQSWTVDVFPERD